MFEQKETKFSWTIEGFDMIPLSRGKSLESLIFSIDVLQTTKFSLSLYPRGHTNNEDDNFISLYLKRHDDDQKDSICVEFVMGLVDGLNTDIYFQKCEHEFEKNCKKGYNKFCERNMSLNSRYFLHNKLTVFCLLLLKEFTATWPKHISLALYRDFTGLLVDGIHSDMTIVVGEDKFKVHRFILENRCPSLMSRMESRDNIYILKGNIEAKVMWSLLLYLYNGAFFEEEMLEAVLAVAHTYGFTELKQTFLPKPIIVKASTKIIVSEARFEVKLRQLVLNLKSELSYLVISYETPDWSWVRFSLLKTQSDHKYEMRIQRLYKNEVTFIQCQVHYYNVFRCQKLTLTNCEHLFQTKDDWVTEINISSLPLKKIEEVLLHFEIRTSVDDGRYREIITNVISHVDCPIYTDKLGIFQKDLRNLYASMKFADLILCVDDEPLPAHKAILCARSQVFSKMFEHDTLEKQTDVVKIEDVDVGTMKALLMYVYCGDVHDSLSVTQAIQLYIAAEKYQLLVLREECSKYLKSSISAENVGDLIVLADLHYDENLKKCAYSFVISHPKEIIDSEFGLSALKHGDMNLYHDILNMLLRHMAENAAYLNFRGFSLKI